MCSSRMQIQLHKSTRYDRRESVRKTTLLEIDDQLRSVHWRRFQWHPYLLLDSFRMSATESWPQSCRSHDIEKNIERIVLVLKSIILPHETLTKHRYRVPRVFFSAPAFPFWTVNENHDLCKHHLRRRHLEDPLCPERFLSRRPAYRV
jgi:hypothetical protein